MHIAGKAVSATRKPGAVVRFSLRDGTLDISPRLFLFLALAAVAVVFVLYLPALNFQFILDDHHFVNDPRIQTSGHFWKYFTGYVWSQVANGPSSFYRPMFAVWLRLNAIFTGMSSWGWHLLSIAKHATAAVLLGLLVWKLLRNRTAALLAAALFALHPAQTESVAWVTVPDPLMTAFAFGSFLLYFAHSDRVAPSLAAQKKGKKRREPTTGKWLFPKWLLGSSALCFAALLTKETAIILPVVFLVLILEEAYLNSTTHSSAKNERLNLWRRVLPFLLQFGPFAAVTALYLLLRMYALGGKLSAATQHLPLRTVVLSWPAMFWFYMKVIFWPIKSRAFADPLLASRFSVSQVLLPGLGVVSVILVLAAGIVWAWKKAGRDLSDRDAKGIRRALLLGASLLVLPLLLTLNLNALDPGDSLHGRYTYLPLAGLTLLLAAAWRLINRKRVAVFTALVAVFLASACTLLTTRQEGMWKDDLTVYTVAHTIAPHNVPVALDLSLANVQVALTWANEGQCDEAEPIFNEAIRQNPQDWYAWAGLGECLYKQNDLSKASDALEHAYTLSKQPRVKEMWQMVQEKLGAPGSN